MQHLYLNILFSLPIKYQKKTSIFKFCIITKKYLQNKLAKGKIHKTRMSSHRQETQSLRSQEIHIQTKRTIIRKKNDIHKKPHLKIKNLTCEMISSKDHHINLKRKRKPIFSISMFFMIIIKGISQKGGSGFVVLIFPHVRI